MNRKIDFTRERYEDIKNNVEEFYKKNGDYAGQIVEGAVCCDFTILEDGCFEKEDYCVGSGFVINAYFYLLGKDTGYGETDFGTPYDCVCGFYAYMKPTYEEFIDGIVSQFEEYVGKYKELADGVNETERTWENEEKKKAV